MLYVKSCLICDLSLFLFCFEYDYRCDQNGVAPPARHGRSPSENLLSPALGTFRLERVRAGMATLTYPQEQPPSALPERGGQLFLVHTSVWCPVTFPGAAPACPKFAVDLSCHQVGVLLQERTW